MALLTAPGLSTPQGQRGRAILEMLYAAGVRVSKLVGLDMGTVDLALGEVRVLGKGDKERITLLGIPAVRALERYLEDGRPRLLGKQQSPARGRPTRVLFLNRLGTRLSAPSVQLMLDHSQHRLG